MMLSLRSMLGASDVELRNVVAAASSGRWGCGDAASAAQKVIDMRADGALYRECGRTAQAWVACAHCGEESAREDVFSVSRDGGVAYRLVMWSGSHTCAGRRLPKSARRLEMDG